MPKIKHTYEIESYGIYTLLDRKSKKLPQIMEFNNKIPVRSDIEFGVILKITKAKGDSINFIIKHPKWEKSEGGFIPNFEGKIPIKGSPYRLFIGDYFWKPWKDKAGIWQIQAWHNGKKIIDHIFEMYLEE